MTYKYVFGPVMSGRLGHSLGLDLLGDRVCSMDCVYCEVGATRNLTLERKPYVRAAEILKELSAWKDEGMTPPDMVTLGGLGEPCLNSEMATVIEGAKILFPETDIAVLTNSSLLVDPIVRKELAEADVVLPSLDSLLDKEFAQVNRPYKGMTPEAVAKGLLGFREEFNGKIFLEILLIEGINDSDDNLKRLMDFCKRLKPDRVDVVTSTRPGTVRAIRPVKAETLSRWRMGLEQNRETIRSAGREKNETMSTEQLTALIQASLARRPQTTVQLAKALNVSRTMVAPVVETLLRTGAVIPCKEREEIFYHGTGHVIED